MTGIYDADTPEISAGFQMQQKKLKKVEKTLKKVGKKLAPNDFGIYDVDTPHQKS